MSTRFRRATHDYELLPRRSSDLLDEASSDRRSSTAYPQQQRQPSLLARLKTYLPGFNDLANPYLYAHYVAPRRRKRSFLRLCYWFLFFAPYAILALVLFVAVFFPTYTHQPRQYEELRRTALGSGTPGRANPRNEKVFIAASIYEEEGELTGGLWGGAVMMLVSLLGPQNVHLSVYENDADEGSKRGLKDLERSVTCNSTFVAEDFDLSTLPRTKLPTGETRIKRIAFLAEVRNRALAPLDDSPVRFDRVLYINDVLFDPIEAAQLLFSTNADPETGRANYDAACAVDFINPFKFYDRFATRDYDGFDMGIPFFPWFTDAGSATSRNDVLAGKDAVRVKSCWGGMTAYRAELFQDQRPFTSATTLPRSSNSDAEAASTAAPATNATHAVTLPLRFRHEPLPFWESSECCLINADLAHYLSHTPSSDPQDGPRIFLNPFVRVAYSASTLSWLRLTRRPERLYAPIHNMLNSLVGFPVPNPRREEQPGDSIQEREWAYDDWAKGLRLDASEEDRKGRWVNVTREVDAPGGFCAGRQLLVINEPEGNTGDGGSGSGRGKGETWEGQERWGKVFAPRPPA